MKAVSILISSHISSDLESLCDDFYMIHAGKIILHEDTDVLLSDYAVLKVSEEEYEKLDQQYLIKDPERGLWIQVSDKPETILYGKLSGCCN